MTSPPSPGAEPATARHRVTRAVWFAAGVTATVVGLIGIALPILPTTGPLIIAVACFARSSARMEAWVLSLPGVGQQIADYRAGLGMRRRIKVYVTAIITLAIAFSVWRVGIGWVQVCIVALGVLALADIWWRVPTRERVEAERT